MIEKCNFQSTDTTFLLSYNCCPPQQVLPNFIIKNNSGGLDILSVSIHHFQIIKFNMSVPPLLKNTVDNESPNFHILQEFTPPSVFGS